MRVILEGMHGLGDNIYQRAVVREYSKEHEVYLVTSWPQLYADLPVMCVKPQSLNLRTQAKNFGRPDLKWHTLPQSINRIKWHYVNRSGSIVKSLCDSLAVDYPKLCFSGPAPVVACPVQGRYVIVRPATIRSEWRADSRNPKPEYIAQAAKAFRDRGYTVVSIADLADGKEWALEPLPEADITWHAGELNLESLLALVNGASAVIGGVGWLVPAAVAYQVPMFLIFGGWGLHNGPGRIFDPRMPSGLIDAVLPDRFCMCGSAHHDCDKTISDIGERIARFANSIHRS